MFHKVCLIFQKSYSEVAVIRSGGEKIKLKPSPWSSARHRAVEVSQPAATENRGKASWAFVHILAPWLIHAAKHQKECFEFQGSSTIASKCQNAINHTCARNEEEESPRFDSFCSWSAWSDHTHVAEAHHVVQPLSCECIHASSIFSVL